MRKWDESREESWVKLRSIGSSSLDGSFFFQLHISNGQSGGEANGEVRSKSA